MSESAVICGPKEYVTPVRPVSDSDYDESARETLRAMIAAYERNQFHPDETPNWPYPLRKLLTGRNRVLIFTIKNGIRKTASGIVTGAGDTFGQFVPSAGYICKLSEYVEQDSREKDYMPILDGIRKTYDEHLTGKPFLGPAIFYRGLSADTYEAAGGIWAETEYKMTRGIYEPVER